MNAISFSSSRKQKRLGPAPFASMEDTSTEEKGQMEHQNNHQAYRSTNDKFSNDFHRTSPTKSLENPSALAPATPRIDISRASSHSSHHDSRDSSPENVFEQVGTGTLQDSGGLGFREEDTLDLRNSTEELQFMESEKGTDEKEKPKTQLMYGSSSVQRASPIIWKLDDAPTTLLSQLQQHQQLLNRKDSASSEVVAFLSISGRTSRLSSVGSQGSANSKLSATSALSGISRSPSPHKMLLETSFCGTKPSQNFADGSIASSSLEPTTENVLEQVILSRKKDPTVAVLAEGVQLQLPIEDSIAQQAAPIVVANISGFEQHSNGDDRHVRRKSDCGTATVCLDMMPHFKMGQTSRSVGNKRNIPPRDLKNSIIGVMPSGTEYIRIKLKPDHCYSDNGIADNERVIENAKENGGSELVITHHEVPNITRSPSPANVSVSRKNSFCSLFKFKETTPIDKLHDLQQSQQSRKKRTSTTSNESGAIGIDASANLTPSKQKLVLKMFRPKRDSKSKSPSPMGSASDQLYDGEDRVDVGGDYSLISNKNTTQVSSATTGYRSWGGKALDGQSIHIPLHTPPEERRPRETLPSSAVNAISTSSVALDSISVSTSITSILKNPKPKTVPKQPRIANMTVTIHDRPKPMPPLKCYRIDNPDGSILIPLKSPIEDKTIDSHHWESVIGELSQRIEKQTCEDREETVDIVIPRKKTSKNTDLIKTGLLLQEYDIESLNSNQNRIKNSMVASPPKSSSPMPPPPPPPLPTLSQPLSSQPAPVIPTTFKQEACEVQSKLKKNANPGIEKLGTLPQQVATAAKMMQKKQQQQAFFHLRMSSGSDDKIFSTTLNDYSTELEQHTSTVGSLHRSTDNHNNISSELPGKAFAGLEAGEG
ncbi:uncharacterized protein LOC126571534 isoform X2 [Anopheles aquasalis]|uniref:uncharacterized protein LOC126571534 isoform X2 n=1 Tax=Anopheles aquasalis TaxID=42839 RepID=UPI00215A5185|nr:uncharacterized protein LOC126571534 isoform X2 [Anopheles aquasalis]